MKQMTMSDIKELRNAILYRTAECESLKKQAEKIENLIPVMSLKSKEKAAKELLELRLKIRENEKFMKKAEAQIQSFFAVAA